MDQADAVARFAALGVEDPEGWARSERTEGIPQLARATFLRAIWDDLDRWADEAWTDGWAAGRVGVPEEVTAAIRDLLARGVDRRTITTLCHAVAQEATFGVLARIDDECDQELDSSYPGWRLVELDGVSEEPTGRVVVALHESMLER